MYSVILCAHGTLAESLKHSTEMIYGKTEDFHAITFEPGENADDLYRKMGETIKQNLLEKVLILVDLFKGSPYNAAATLAMKNENLEVLAGVNLPLCIEAAVNQSTQSLSGIVDYLKGVAPDTIQSFRDQFKNTAEEEDFE